MSDPKTVTAADVLACTDEDAAETLARRVPYGAVTAADVLACRYEEAAAVLARRVLDRSVTEADVVACEHERAAMHLALRLPAGAIRKAWKARHQARHEETVRNV
jgi:hypothetical protein